LDLWKISYHVTCQSPNELMVIFPEANHQGFSNGITLAEAVNYADSRWNIEGYCECQPWSCPEGYIPKALMELRGEEEIQYEVGSSDDNESDGHNSEPSDRKKKNLKERTAQSKHNGTKRKPRDQPVPRKLQKRPPVTELLQELTPIPKTLIQPDQVYRIFTERLDTPNPNLAFHLTRLFFATASPDAFYQLRNVCIIAREGGQLSSDRSISQTILALDKLEGTLSMIHIQRRYYLVNLVDHRNQLEKTHLDQKFERPIRAVRARNNRSTGVRDEKTGRASSLALRDLMSQAYPDLMPTQHGENDEYQKKLKSLKNKLAFGRNWNMMQQRFTAGILALVPSDGDYDIQNSA